ncbi:phage integrase family protein [Magnetococcus marinus MC-1]|uniref:Phage integrase family protein n=1 Tax=Magnetococcus marinus (strain ATCC BAA-1437 / JCM 17883 / MC-1) TaxID=156889 RepID=A0L890_MAGMM|nr:tyrosine-type recombinase/integrase [Magnetococcus marinus]ABK44183.1 phage integrase family protein [Magnetococcus marinus MC-1]
MHKMENPFGDGHCLIANDLNKIDQLLRQDGVAACPADRTHKARSSDAKRFVQWCQQQGVKALPASPETVTGYIEAMIQDKALATVRRYVSSISTLHSAVEMCNPAHSPEVRESLRKAADQCERPSKGTRPITREMVQRMVQATLGSTRDLRDVALLMVAYDTMLRRTEMVALDVANFHFGRDGFATVTCHSEDDLALPTTRCIAPDTVRAVEAWMRASNTSTGPMFRSIDRAGVIGDRLSDRGLVRAFKRLARQAGLDPEGISGLSCRVGAAGDMMKEGFRLKEVMQAGGWRSPVMVSRYHQQKRALADNEDLAESPLTRVMLHKPGKRA